MVWNLQISSRNFRNLLILATPVAICWYRLIQYTLGLLEDYIYQSTNDILRSANLRRHMQPRPHIHGYLFDFVIFHDDDNLIRDVSVSPMLSDHILISIDVTFQKNPFQVKYFIQDIYVGWKWCFFADLWVSSMVLHDTYYLSNLYISTLRDFVDQHASLRTK